MGKLLIGHYGQLPDAESQTILLKDCHQRLGLKPSDFVSSEEPDFFRHARGATGKYLVFQLSAEEIGTAPIWRAGYYLLPIGAAEVVKAFNQPHGPKALDEGARPFQVHSKENPPEEVLQRARDWAIEAQPRFFKCKCEELILRLDAPWALRKRWRARLSCPARCQPAVSHLV